MDAIGKTMDGKPSSEKLKRLMEAKSSEVTTSELLVFYLDLAFTVWYYYFGTITNGRRLSLSFRREHFFSLQSVRVGGMHDGYI